MWVMTRWGWLVAAALVVRGLVDDILVVAVVDFVVIFEDLKSFYFILFFEIVMKIKIKYLFEEEEQLAGRL